MHVFCFFIPFSIKLIVLEFYSLVKNEAIPSTLEPCHVKTSFLHMQQKIFATLIHIVLPLFFLNPKFPASSHLLGHTARFVSYLGKNQEDRFSCDNAHYILSHFVFLFLGKPTRGILPVLSTVTDNCSS